MCVGVSAVATQHVLVASSGGSSEQTGGAACILAFGTSWDIPGTFLAVSVLGGSKAPCQILTRPQESRLLACSCPGQGSAGCGCRVRL